MHIDPTEGIADDYMKILRKTTSAYQMSHSHDSNNRLSFQSRTLRIFLFLVLLQTTCCYQTFASNAPEGKFSDLISRILEGDQTLGSASRQSLVSAGKAAAPDIIEAFKNSNYTQRMALGNILIEIGDNAIPALENVLLGPDDKSAANAAILLGEIGASSIPSLSKALTDRIFPQGTERKREAAYALGRIGLPAYPAMMEMIVVDEAWNESSLFLHDALVSAGRSAIPTLIGALKDSSPVRRYSSARVLLAIKDESSVPALVEVLSDRYTVICSMAAQALAGIGNKAKTATPVLIARLQEPHGEFCSEELISLQEFIYQVNFRRIAIDALRAINPTPSEVIPILVDCLGDQNSEVRAAALETLEKFGKNSESAFHDILFALNDAKGGVRKRAVIALSIIKQENHEGLQRLIVASKDKDHSVRTAVAQGFSRFKSFPQSAVPILQGMLKDNYPEVRAASIAALGEFRDHDQECLQLLIQSLSDGEHVVQLEAVKTLGKIGVGSEDAVRPLMKIFLHETGAIQNEAASSLQRIGLVAVSELERGLSNQDAFIRAKILEILGNIQPRPISALPLITGQLHDSDSHVRHRAAVTLGQMGKSARDSLDSLILATEDQFAEVRLAATQALGALGEFSNPLIYALINRLKDTEINICRRAVISLGALGHASERAVPEMIHLARNTDKDTKLQVIEAIGNIQPESKDALSILIETLHDKDHDTKIRGVRALANMGEKAHDALPILLSLLDDSVQEVKYSAADALVDISVAIGDKGDTQRINQLITVRQKLQSISEIVTEKYGKNGHLKSLNRAIGLLEKPRNWKWSDVVRPFIIVLIIHSIFWALLIFAYPHSPRVQTFFWFDPSVRRVTGFGYVGALLTWIPPLRSRLLIPFRESFILDANLEMFDRKAYFDDLQVSREGESQIISIGEAVPEIRGQIMLKGESGLGKTMFLQNLVKASTRIVVYLSADKCAGGVVEAIQGKVHGYVKDLDFLQTLINRRAIDICID